MKKQAMSESANWSYDTFCLSATQQLKFNTETTEVTETTGADGNTVTLKGCKV